jgi:queuine tRNA-ribosyltransferase
MFDSVLPTHLARIGSLLTRFGRLRIVVVAFRADERPIDPECRCLACRQFSRAYLHHVFRARELLGHRFAALLNLTYRLDLVVENRSTLRAATFGDLRQRWQAREWPADETKGTLLASPRMAVRAT